MPQHPQTASSATVPDSRGLPQTRWTPWRLFFLLCVPQVWLLAALVSWKYPGDEYLLFQFVNGLPGVWFPLLFGPVRGPDVFPILLLGGYVTMLVLGACMDGVRVQKLLWCALYVFGIPVILWWGLSEFESLEKAYAKNGSLLAYAAAATNLSLYQASVLALVGTAISRLFDKSRTV